MNLQSRRSFIKTTAATTAALAAQGLVAQVAPVSIRRSVNELADNDPLIVSYKKAVQVMQSRPASDPTSWAAQAKIHQDHCPHGNWFFLPWHRSYLQWFEDICREASGDESFALPYWDWTKYPQVPPHFWGENNPLNHERDIAPQGIISEEFVGSNVINNNVLATPDFETFASSRATAQRGSGGTGRLEGTPHNNVHVELGGDMLTMMSPLDPIFWLHHANVDRLWTVWNARGNANTSAPAWSSFTFTSNFVNRAKIPQTQKISALLSTHALGYRYDTQSNTPSAINLTSLLGVQNGATVVATNDQPVVPKVPLAFSMKPNAALAFSLTKMTDSILKSAPRPREAVRVRLQDIEIPKDPRVRVRVFINCDYLTLETPLNSPSYVGSFAFFGLDHQHPGAGGTNDHEAKPSFIFDITPTLARLRFSPKVKKNGDITVQLLALPGTGSGMPFKVETFTIEAVANVD